MKKLLIIGAGEAGKMVARELQSDFNLFKRYEIIGYIDDNPHIKDVFGIKVLGRISDIKDLILIHAIDTIFITIPSASSELISRILDAINGSGVDIRIIPGMVEIIEGVASYQQLRQFEPADLLGREEVSFDIDKMYEYYENKTIFITGAGGSIGSEIFAQLLALPIKSIIAFGHGENSIHTLVQEYASDPRFNFVIGDIRDFSKLKHSMNKYKPDIMFHAAAHKHVPLMENHPDEAIKNNILGTYYAAQAAIDCNVSRFIFVSTDKAVNPTSIMGATKRIAEKIILSLNHLTTTIFSLTRFGNVLGSRGSVVPIFKKQIEQGGPVTVTHPEMTRYFMSIREAARLVIKSATIHNGHIHILDMGKPVRIADLAKTMIRLHGFSTKDIPIQYTGIRPGEKLYEEVLTQGEDIHKTLFEKLYIAFEQELFYDATELKMLIQRFSSLADEEEDIAMLKNEILDESKI